MVHIFNRCELVTLFDLSQVEDIRKALCANNIKHQVKTIDRASPSMFRMGSRERSGTLFQDTAQNWRYVIYVKRNELSKVQNRTGLTPIR